MEFLLDYAVFLAKAVTLVVAILVLFFAIASIRRKGLPAAGHLRVSKLNNFFDQLQRGVEQAVLDKAQLKIITKAQAKTAKEEKKSNTKKPRVYVLDFEGDLRASATDSLRNEITALLGMATPQDEVLLRLESGGGLVHSYGLASSQLARVRQAGIPLTICIDKVAASGGYMMACVGSKIISAPFALIGSIGVVAQLPNLHRLLKKNDIDFEVLTAGQYKRTLTVFGENTEKGRAKFQQDLETIHELFKGFVASYRPQLNMEEVASGEVWLGTAALDKRLVDELQTSDEYLAKRAKTADLFHLRFVEKKTLQERIGIAVGITLDRFVLNWLNRLNQQRF